MRTLLSSVMVFAFAFSFMGIALAQAPGTGIITDPLDPALFGQQGAVTDTSSLVAIIVGLVEWIAWFVGLIAVLMGLYAGVLFITGGGNPEMLAKARSILLYAIVGIAVAILAFGLVAISQSLLGV